MVRAALSLWLLPAAVVLTSCTGPVMTAVGESDDLVVVRNAGTLPEATALLVAAMEAENPWLLGEPAFGVTVTPASNFGTVSNRRHLLLLGTWGSGGVEDLVRRRISSLEPGEVARLVIAYDLWAKGQVVGAIMGRDEAELAEFLSARSDEILRAFESAVESRLVESLRERATQTGKTEQLEERFGWSLAPPSGYDLITTHAEDGFVFFRRTRPDRSIFVYWESGESDYVTDEFAIAKREELARLHYDGDEIEWRRELAVETVDFQGRPAVRLAGWWGNRRLVGGGPFVTYCFYEPGQGRVYILDGSLFAPGLEKTPLMRNLDAVLHTFSPGGPAPG